MDLKHPSRFIREEKGFGILVIVAIIAMTSTIMLGYSVIGNAQSQQKYDTFVEGRRKTSERILGYVQSMTMMSSNLNNKNSPDQNTALRDCVATGDPSVDCPGKFSLNFYAPTADGFEKVIGTADHPAYQTLLGENCEPMSTIDTSNCNFKSVALCQVRCPGGQTACGMIKMLDCDVEVSPLGESVVGHYLHSQKTTRFAASYALRLSRDKKSYIVSHE